MLLKLLVTCFIGFTYIYLFLERLKKYWLCSLKKSLVIIPQLRECRQIVLLICSKFKVAPLPCVSGEKKLFL